ncbi:hypothetical protein CDG60_12620 [Acinetobacter chinensis]|uniref:Uncharacterized protein n=1 Tax=Acinetobacter chinensis TaxID=2004650 RepID=A0A3B7LZ89_9GAMM|nr:hypothetical protein [Acinetobacter chinensis]AXY57335.1 hypothetical protein CDG60_12620 [Acinetobacter chinensis]
MKNHVLLVFLISCFFCFTNTHADDEAVIPVRLKSGCIKDNPLVKGETDQELLKLYQQVCDKKNKENKDAYFVKVAERFQQLGQAYKALNVIGELQAKNIQSHTLTDVKFLAATSLATEALKQIQDGESRYLTTEYTYPAALGLADAIRSAKTIHDTAVVKIQPLVAVKKNTVPKSTKPQVAAKVPSVRSTKISRPKPNNSETLVRSENKTVSPVIVKSGSNPFSGLNN